jgi:hypothetical protein
MTEVQESTGRTRWFRRGGDATAEAGGATPRTGRWSGSSRHAARTEAGAVDGSTVEETGETTKVVRDPDPDIGRRRRAVGEAQLRERFGGRKIGAAFFGWLVAVGMTVMLSTIAAAVGLAVTDSMGLHPGGVDAAPVGLTGGVVLLVVLGVSYFTGGYVAGRLARFDGTRNGVLAWIVGLLVTIIAAVVGAAFGAARADLFSALRLPVLTGDLTAVTVAGVIALVLVLVVTAVAAALGGRMGEQFHRRVDRAAERL